MIDLSGHIIGHYEIAEPLGEGGMARVYRAYDRRLGGVVAVKVVRKERLIPEETQQIIARFELEAQALKRLSHPHIVPIIDYGEHDGMPYFVMKFLPGGSLKKRLAERGGRLHWVEAAQLLAPIARALEYAHGQGIIHRDIKPANILLTKQGRSMLADFGVARAFQGESQTSLTRSGIGIGTPEYMAPEQGLGQPIDHRADIYALGVVVYELITGRRPFQADTPMALIVKHINDPLPRPRTLRPDVPSHIEQVVLRALAKKPTDRYPTMAEFASALEKWVSDSKPKHPAATRPHPILIGIGGFVLMGGMGFVLVSGSRFVETWLATATPTVTAAPTAPASATVTPTATATISPTLTPTPTNTATETPTATPLPTDTPFPTPLPQPTRRPPTSPPVIPTSGDPRTWLAQLRCFSDNEVSPGPGQTISGNRTVVFSWPNTNQPLPNGYDYRLTVQVPQQGQEATKWLASFRTRETSLPVEIPPEYAGQLVWYVTLYESTGSWVNHGKCSSFSSSLMTTDPPTGIKGIYFWYVPQR